MARFNSRRTFNASPERLRRPGDALKARLKLGERKKTRKRVLKIYPRKKCWLLRVRLPPTGVAARARGPDERRPSLRPRGGVVFASEFRAEDVTAMGAPARLELALIKIDTLLCDNGLVLAVSADVHFNVL